jgi:hypothetical protein
MRESRWIRSSFHDPHDDDGGLEATRIRRGDYILFQDSSNAAVHGPVRVSLARWSRFLAAIKTARFEPQREGRSLTVCIGDLSDEGVVSRRSYVETTVDRYEAFARGVRAGEFDHL